MPEMHLRQPGFTCKAGGLFTKNKERIKKFKETRDSQYIFQNILDKYCIQHDMAYGHFTDLTRRTGSDKILHDKAFNIAKNQRLRKTSDVYQCKLASLVYKFLELHKTIIRKLEKNKSTLTFIGNIWGADLADMQLINKFSKGTCFLL